jgi:redox-sensitive bicupin YhaK (pirin superfamily)
MTDGQDVIQETFPLGFQWPVIDPFLFCVHHVDDYPAGNDDLGPQADLHGRDLGADFAGIDGWRMYHGEVVPGFPGHPHRGFETVTFVRRGLIDHSDSLGATARFGRGDTQWLTAGRGIVHSEMFPLVNPEAPNPLELFQIWLNLPAADKMVDAYFTMLWANDTPHALVGDEGQVVDITVIAGALDGQRPPSPPPNSWAARDDADVAIWHLRADPLGTVALPAARSERTHRTVYVYAGSALVGDGEITAPTGVRVRADTTLPIIAGDDGAEILVLQGRPIAEPVAQYGPFVLNDREGIVQAFEDYQRTGFGGWPFDRSDPVHPRDRARFARHADGHVEEAVPV